MSSATKKHSPHIHSNNSELAPEDHQLILLRNAATKKLE